MEERTVIVMWEGGVDLRIGLGMAMYTKIQLKNHLPALGSPAHSCTSSHSPQPLPLCRSDF
jgi:hypothetical protein